MNNLIAFFARFYLIILFIFLEGISLFWVFTSNNYQASYAESINTEISGTVYGWFNGLDKYLSLTAVNDSLLIENSRLKNLVKSSYEKDSILFGDGKDTLSQQKYTYIGGSVINNSIQFKRNFLTLKVGSKNGIKPGQAVISPNGIVGIVAETSPNFSTVSSILSTDFNISALVTETGNIGTISWKGKDPNIMTLSIPPTQSKFLPNITYHVVVSNYSEIFPKNYAVGTFTFNKVKGDNSIEAEVQLVQEMSSLKYVYVVNNLFNSEKSELEDQTQKNFNAKK